MCPSGSALAIPLGPTNPWLIVIAKETLIFWRAGFSPALWLLVPTFLLPHAPAWVTPLPSQLSPPNFAADSEFVKNYRKKFYDTSLLCSEAKLGGRVEYSPTTLPTFESSIF